MKYKGLKDRFRFGTRLSGTTLIELMIAGSMCSFAILGAMGFQYHAAADAQRADVQATATRIALSVLETWKGTGGYPAFIPSEPNCSNNTIGPDKPSDFNLSNQPHYEITAEGTKYYATLSYKASTSITPEALNVCIGWKNDYKSAAAVSELIQSVSLTSYINN